MLVLELDAKGGVREQFRHDTGKLQKFFLRHSIPGKSCCLAATTCGDILGDMDGVSAKIGAEPSG